MKPALRIGVIGVGAIAQVAQLPTLARLRGAQLVALCDNDGPQGARARRATRCSRRLHGHRRDARVRRARCGGDLDAEPFARAARAERARGGRARAVRAAARAERARHRAHSRGGDAERQEGRRREQSSLSLRRAGRGRVSARRRAREAQRRAHRCVSDDRSAPNGWRHRRANLGGGAFMEFGFPLLDLALWLADFPDAVRVCASRWNAAVRRLQWRMRCSCTSSAHKARRSPSMSAGPTSAQEDRWWFDVLATRGSAQLSPLQGREGAQRDAGRRDAARRRGARERDDPVVPRRARALSRGAARGSRYETPPDQVVVCTRLPRRSSRRRMKGKRLAC